MATKKKTFKSPRASNCVVVPKYMRAVSFDEYVAAFDKANRLKPVTYVFSPKKDENA